MGHRFSRRLGRRATQSGEQTVQDMVDLAFGRPFIPADSYAIDSVTGKVAAFIDMSDTSHRLVQSTSAKQVAIPAAHADYPGKVCAAFAGGQHYTSNGSATRHDYLQNGPCDFAAILTPTVSGTTQIIWENALPAQGGSLVYVDDSGPFRNTLIRTGSSPQREVAITNGTPYYLYGYADSASSPQHSLKRSGSAADTGALTGTDRAGTLALTFGGRSSDTLLLNARVAVLMHLAPILTTDQRTKRAAWAATYGVAA